MTRHVPMKLSRLQRPLLAEVKASAAGEPNSTAATEKRSSTANCKEIMEESIRDNFKEFRRSQLWRAMLAEFLGTLVLVFIGCGACMNDNDANPGILVIALAFGLIVATIVWMIGHVSGSHVNPAVTIGMLVARRINVVRAIGYIISQSSGAIVGCGILKGLTPQNANETYGLTTVWKELTPGQGLGIEILITFILVFTIFSCIDPKRNDLNGSTPLTIGLTVSVCHLFAIKYTGSSMNPARTFGPAVITNSWQYHYVYWFGPIIGGIIGALLYDLIFSESASIRHLVSYFSSSNYGEEVYDVNPDDDMKHKDEVSSV